MLSSLLFVSILYLFTLSIFHQGYLRHTREQLILTALSESQSQIQTSFHQTLDNRLHSSWSSQKRKILEEVGAGDPLLASASDGPADSNSNSGGNAFERSIRGRLGESSNLGASQARNGAGGHPLPGQTLAAHHRSLKYDAIVKQLNAARSASSPSTFPLAKMYASSLASSTGPLAGSNQTSPLLAQSFSLISSIVREGELGVGERTYAPGYVGPGSDGELGRQVRKGIVEGGKRFLEEQYVVVVSLLLLSLL